jgi:hypothetical protein
MTVTITRLYDDHVSAERAVRDLEATGIPHKDISIMSNNADSWYKGGRTDTTAQELRAVALIAITTALTTERRGRAPEPELGPRLAERPVCWPGWAC